MLRQTILEGLTPTDTSPVQKPKINHLLLSKVITSSSTPKLPVVQKTGQRIFTDPAILVNPMFDASEREIYARSGYLSAGKTLVAFLSNSN